MILIPLTTRFYINYAKLVTLTALCVLFTTKYRLSPDFKLIKFQLKYYSIFLCFVESNMIEKKRSKNQVVKIRHSRNSILN